MLEEMPIATIEAETATGNPALVSMNGSVTDAYPELIPYGRTRKKIMSGEVVRGGVMRPPSCHKRRRGVRPPRATSAPARRAISAGAAAAISACARRSAHAATAR
jgi:hypothetical protein